MHLKIEDEIRKGIDLRTKGVLVTLHLRAYSARKHDRVVTQQTNSEHDASHKAGRYNKQLIDVATYLEPITKLSTEIRQYHYDLTLPWLEGSRMLSMTHFETYCAAMNEKLDQYRRLTQNFIDAYPQAKEQARTFLGKMYREADYPTIQEISRKFVGEYFVTPLPDTSDFRIDLPDYAIAKTAAKIQESINIATRDAWTRLHEAVTHIYEKMSGFETGDTKRLHDTMIGNLRDLVALMPGLNITEDPALTAITAAVEDHLTGASVEQLRESETARKELKRKAADILARMKPSMDGGL
jgi:hypothetical protein